MRTPTNSEAVQLSGVLNRVKSVVPKEDESCWISAELADGSIVCGIITRRDDLADGLTYTFVGRWEDNQRFGWQFKFDSHFEEPPGDELAAAAYLAQHCEGIGRVLGGRLVARHGLDVVRRLMEEPETIDQDIISHSLAQTAGRALQKVCPPGLREAHLAVSGLLRGRGFRRGMVRSVLDLWREKAADVIRRDPFQLMTRGLASAGFRRCDQLYRHLKLPLKRLKRQALAAWWGLTQLDGDTWATLEHGLEVVRREIGLAPCRDRRAVALLCRTGNARVRLDARNRPWIASGFKAIRERMAAVAVRRMLAAPGTIWPAIEAEGPLAELSDHQRDQLRGALTHQVAILTGSPGTGKTFTAGALIASLVHSIGSDRIKVCAPTGKAAVRINEKLAEVAPRIKATTIHKLLGVVTRDTAQAGAPDDEPEYAFGEGNPIPAIELIVVDEASMIDASLGGALLSALPAGCHVLLVGDVGQLPPVGHGAVLRDLVDAGVPVARLSEIRRNAGDIVTTCHAIAQGRLPRLATLLAQWQERNLVYLGAVSGDGPAAQMASLHGWIDGQGFDPVADVQVVCAKNDTRKKLNEVLQGLLNPDGQRAPVGEWRVNDKVICLKNDKLPEMIDGRVDMSAPPVFVANGDIGRVLQFRGHQAIVQFSAPDRTLVVPLGRAGAAEQDEARKVHRRDDLLREEEKSKWSLAYAVTCHKMQGSEAPVVIVVVEPAGKLLCREWIYTAFSRPRKLGLVLGEWSDLEKGVRRVTLPDRKTFLRELIVGEMELA